MLERLRNAIRVFMIGRHGSDQLSLALVITGLILYFILLFTGIPLLNVLSVILYAIAIFRMFSKNNAQRNAENQKYLDLVYKVTTSVRQFINRQKNGKQYKYFKCPQCKTRLRLPRNVGEVTVTCSKCGNKFKQKA